MKIVMGDMNSTVRIDNTGREEVMGKDYRAAKGGKKHRKHVQNEKPEERGKYMIPRVE